jgi:anaerobic magnesium-protoporphyrin IX monomethyl ester cyclase
MSNCLLINYPGYPATLREFYLDNGLANLAAALLSKGHVPLILDYANPDLISWFFPYKFKDDIRNVVIDINSAHKKGLIPDGSVIDRFYEVDDRINAFQAERIREFAHEEIIKKIRSLKPDFVGFKLWIGEGFVNSIKIAGEIKKEFPGLKIFAGGPQVDWFDENIYRLGFGEYFDALAYCDGEETICGLADHAQGKIALKDIPNLIFREGGRIVRTQKKRIEDLGSLAAPVYDPEIYHPMDDNKKIKIVMIDESRGCPNSCSFCLHPHKSGNYWVTREPVKIVDEMENVIRKYKTNIFRFAGSNPPPDLKRGIAKEIIKRGLKVKYGAFGHARGMAEEDYKLMKESGCVSLFFGVESGSQQILDRAMNKGNKVGQIKESLVMCREAGIKAVASVIVPAPFDTEETIEETFNLLAETKPASVIVNFPGALPHTKWFDEMREYGFETKDKDAYIKEGMVYTVKNFYPPELWREMPGYTLGGKTIKEVMRISSVFSKRLQVAGIPTRITDDLSLLVEALGTDPVELMNTAWTYISSGDKAGIEKMISGINVKIKKGAAASEKCLIKK